MSVQVVLEPPARLADVEDAIHQPHRPGACMLLEEDEHHSDVFAKMPIAFVRTSRPCVISRLMGEVPGNPAGRGGGQPPISAVRRYSRGGPPPRI